MCPKGGAAECEGLKAHWSESAGSTALRGPMPLLPPTPTILVPVFVILVTHGFNLALFPDSVMCRPSCECPLRTPAQLASLLLTVSYPLKFGKRHLGFNVAHFLPPGLTATPTCYHLFPWSLEVRGEVILNKGKVTVKSPSNCSFIGTNVNVLKECCSLACLCLGMLFIYLAVHLS